jgi:hypothetical protein
MNDYSTSKLAINSYLNSSYFKVQKYNSQITGIDYQPGFIYLVQDKWFKDGVFYNTWKDAKRG